MYQVGDKVRVKAHKDVAPAHHGRIVEIYEIHINHNPTLYSCWTIRGQAIAVYEDEISSVED